MTSLRQCMFHIEIESNSTQQAAWYLGEHYHMRNLRFLKLFPLYGDPVASYRELQVKIQSL